jgi:N-carbamoyl-L-amino-acid hydrolase
VSSTSLRIDRARLLDRLAVLSDIGSIEGTTGSSRLAFTDADHAGRDLVVAWMGELGLELSIDGIGNVIGIRSGTEDLPPVMTGSHIDTVRTGGRYDGNFGVLAGLEVIETLGRAGIETRHPLAVGFFSNEEGARFAPDMMGSLVYVGGMAVEDAHDTVGIDGVSVGAELERIGYLGTSAIPGLCPYAFVELHIEQGPVLEEAGVQIGIVESVQGISWTEITIAGESNHAGTTPIRLRRDAGFVAGEIVTFVRRLAIELGDSQVGTVGMIELHPNLINVVAASATLTVDLRNTDELQLQDAERHLQKKLDQLADSEGVTISTRRLARFEPVRFDGRVVDKIEATARDLGRSTMRMPSGAGHDAQMLARVCPSAMIFTPSRHGISHNPAEHTDPADLEAGANVLLQVLVELAEGGLTP